VFASFSMVGFVDVIVNECKLRGYSQKTIDSYLFHVKRFIDSKKSPREYLLMLIAKGCSDETLRSTGFAIKFYLNILKKDDSGISELLNNLPNVKNAKKLPIILSKDEVGRMIYSTKNLNHRLIIQVGYSAGLRLSEIINLKWQDIDFDRDIIHLKNAKGKKDRIVMLSRIVKEELYKLTQNKQGYVFVTNRDGKYTDRSVQKILENAAIKARLGKKVTPHTLRHSFATHLLENGTDIRYIRDLLGHSDISTTMIYTKVSNKDISRIKSPLD
jgi:integrase/recombinase XerD